MNHTSRPGSIRDRIIALGLAHELMPEGRAGKGCTGLISSQTVNQQGGSFTTDQSQQQGPTHSAVVAPASPSPASSIFTETDGAKDRQLDGKTDPDMHLISEEDPIRNELEHLPSQPGRAEPPIHAKSEEPPNQIKSEEPHIQRELEEPPKTTKSEEPPIQRKSEEPPIHRKSDEPPMQTKSDEPPIHRNQKSRQFQEKQKRRQIKQNQKEPLIQIKSENSTQRNTEEPPMPMHTKSVELPLPSKSELVESPIWTKPARPPPIKFEKSPTQIPRPAQDLNILILGETGVGKSTWINGFVNFLTFDSLAEAEAGKPLTLIPSQFTVVDENYRQVKVNTGDDENERLQSGESATQNARIYPFTVGDTTIRLIDTPGVGDTRGMEQDKVNLQNTLSTLSQVKDIHGICILLMPNNSKLSKQLRFCIQELLTNLHKNASKNIIFCFTNSRGTFYRPGETLPTLETLLHEKKVGIQLNSKTIYCFDSEAYRFLAAAQTVSFSADERESFEKSWTKSVTETERMLSYIRTLTPHPIQSTINLNYSRELVLKLVRPMAEISRNNQLNKFNLEGQMREIEETSESIHELEKRRMKTHTELEIRKFNYPKTVCSNKDCVKVSQVDGGLLAEYISICCSPCSLVGVQHDTIGSLRLWRCSAFSLMGNCKRSNCKHRLAEHLHIYYESIPVLKEIEDESVKESIEQNLSAAQMKQKMIEDKKLEISQYEQEISKIEKASVTFAHFLKTNAITPYNDEMEKYLDHFIKEEEIKAQSGGSRDVLDSLEGRRLTYLEGKKTLEIEMMKGNLSPPEATDVDTLVDELKNLKHSGKTLRDALDCISHAGSQTYADVLNAKALKVLQTVNQAAQTGGKKFWKFVLGTSTSRTVPEAAPRGNAKLKPRGN